jgi:hypothetical protein
VWRLPGHDQGGLIAASPQHLIGTRERFRQIRLHALEALCDRYRDDGRLDAALDAGITAVAADPLLGRPLDGSRDTEPLFRSA